MAMASPLPVREGVGATRLHLPMTGPWATVGAYMAERFFHLEPERLLSRFDRGEIVGRDGTPLTRETPLGAHEFVWYYREPPIERKIPFELHVLHQDDDLVEDRRRARDHVQMPAVDGIERPRADDAAGAVTRSGERDGGAGGLGSHSGRPYQSTVSP